MPHWQWLAGNLAKKIWFRAALISLLSVAGALMSAVLAPFIPYDLSLKIGGGAVDNVLTILASSMLAVTTFSLTAMVGAFSGAAQNLTPRATQLLIEDSAAQNALSTFLGGFLFGIVGIAALSTGIYGDQGRAILFIFTMAMIVWIAITLLRWIQTLSHFGRVPDTIARVEKAGIAALNRHCGPVIATGRADLDVPANGHTVCARETGYVAVIDTEELVKIAERTGKPLHVIAPPGRLVDARTPLAWTVAELKNDDVDDVVGAFTVTRERSFDHDPRFAMIVLAEIGSRALSPAINDPGTAIAALVSGQRIVEKIDLANEVAPERVVFPPLSVEEIVEDLLLPIARDGAPIVEVGIRMQHMLGSLAKAFPESRPAFRQLADDAFERASCASLADPDRDRLTKAHAAAFG
ncbi:MAG: DUF2254 domain-containing protein [Sphingomicrobium sp.]